MRDTSYEHAAAEIERPLLRGWFHVAAAVATLLGTAWLLVIADSATAYVGGAIFGVSLMALYWTSASYHRIDWGPIARRIVMRVDHAMIFVLIAGTYTPICLKVSLAWGVPILAVVWSVAGVGMLLKVLWPDAPRWLGVSLYVGLGWTALVAASEIIDHFSTVSITMLAAGGVLYTVGGLVYALRRPDPWPRYFGYHEVFHTFVVAGSLVHYTLIAFYVLPA